jgi:hypothetical protein
MELPQRKVRPNRSNKKESWATGDDGNKSVKPRHLKKEAAPKETPFHAILSEHVRKTLKAKGIDLDSKGTVDVAVDDARIKLGLGQYAGLAHKDGIVAEGKYTCGEQGVVSITWARAIRFQDDSWQPLKPEEVLKSIVLTEGESAPASCSDQCFTNR